jgi:hypothetical protein
VTEEALELKDPFGPEVKLKPDNSEKDEVLDNKAYKDFTKHEAKEDKDLQEATKGFQFEGRSAVDPAAFGRDALLAHAEALEQTARALRHFIEQAERPDLRRGALRNEPDQGG